MSRAVLPARPQTCTFAVTVVSNQSRQALETLLQSVCAHGVSGVSGLGAIGLRIDDSCLLLNRAASTPVYAPIRTSIDLVPALRVLYPGSRLPDAAGSYVVSADVLARKSARLQGVEPDECVHKTADRSRWTRNLNAVKMFNIDKSNHPLITNDSNAQQALMPVAYKGIRPRRPLPYQRTVALTWAPTGQELATVFIESASSPARLGTVRVKPSADVTLQRVHDLHFCVASLSSELATDPTPLPNHKHRRMATSVVVMLLCLQRLRQAQRLPVEIWSRHITPMMHTLEIDWATTVSIKLLPYMRPELQGKRKSVMVATLKAWSKEWPWMAGMVSPGKPFTVKATVAELQGHITSAYALLCSRPSLYRVEIRPNCIQCDETDLSASSSFGQLQFGPQ